MATRLIDRGPEAAAEATGSHAGIGMDSDDNKVYVKESPSATRKALVDTAEDFTLAGDITFTGTVAMSGAVAITESADGTVSLPAYTFSSDLDTGMYRIGANNIGVAANGAKVLDVGTAGLGVTGTVTASGAINKVTITPPASAAVLTIPDGVTFTGPAASGTAATLAGAETLTNKTIASSATVPYVAGVAAGYKVARGVHTTVDEDDTVVTGLTTVVSVVAQFQSDPAAGAAFVSASIGDQTGSPAAGSVFIKTFESDFTPGTAFSKAINWIAVGT